MPTLTLLADLECDARTALSDAQLALLSPRRRAWVCPPGAVARPEPDPAFGDEGYVLSIAGSEHLVADAADDLDTEPTQRRVISFVQDEVMGQWAGLAEGAFAHPRPGSSAARGGGSARPNPWCV